MIMKVYERIAAEVFAKRTWGTITGGLWGPRHGRTPLDGLLEEFFGEITFDDLLRETIIPALRIDDNEVIYFSKKYTKHLLIKHAAAASSAAQTFFRPAKFTFEGRESKFVDGGVIDNLPALPVIFEMIRENEGSLPENFLVVTVGTGKDHRQRRYMRNSGALNIAKRLASQSIDGKTSSTSQLLNSIRGIRGGNYFEFLPEFPKPSSIESTDLDLACFKKTEIPMNDPSIMGCLIHFVDDMYLVSPEIAKIKEGVTLELNKIEELKIKDKGENPDSTLPFEL